MSSGPRPSSADLDRVAQRVARHGPDNARFIADSLVAAALDDEVERMNAERRPKAVPSAAAPGLRRGSGTRREVPHDAR